MRFTHTTLSLTTMVLTIFCVAPEVTVAAPPPPEVCAKCLEPYDPTLWEKSVTFGFNLSRGNSDTVLLNLNGKAQREIDNNIYRFELDGNYGEDKDKERAGGDKKTQENLKGLAEYKRLLNERLFVGFGGVYLYDDISLIDYRVTLNPVVGYFLLKDDELKLSVEAGPSYIFEEVDNVEDDYLAPRIAERFEYVLSQTSKVYQSSELLIDADDSDNYIINSEAGIKASISANLSLVVTAKDSYDNQPALDREKNDLSVISGIQVSL